MIYATKTGRLIGCDVVKETAKTTTVKFWDETKHRTVRKADNANVRLFTNTDEAEAWIKGGSK